MSNTPNPADEARPRRHQEYEDPHFHDEDEPVPVDDLEPPGPRPPRRGKPQRRLPPPRRRYHDD